MFKMAIKLRLLLSLTAVLAQSTVTSLSLGDGNCLISRTDVIECDYINIDRVQIPEANEYGTYLTRFRFIHGSIRCQILARGHTVNPIQIMGTDNQVLTIFSPGFVDTPTTDYGNRLYVDYNIQCPVGTLAHVDITSIDLEPKNCFDPNLEEIRCRDYVSVMRQSGNREACGNDTSVNFNPTLENSVRVLFRSSPADRYPGFAASVICFQPGGTDNVDCSPAAGTLANTRRKRDGEQLHEEMERQAEHENQRNRPGVTNSNSKTNVRVQRFELQPSVIMSYQRGILSFTTSDRRNRLSSVIRVVDVLYVFGKDDEVEIFRINEHTQLFSKPGLVYIIGRRAYYHTYVPADYVLTKEEQEVLTSLTTPHLAIARAKRRRTTGTPYPWLTAKATPSQHDISIDREKRDIELMFDDEAVLLALSYENACNPVLRASARSIIEESEIKDPERMNSLRLAI